MSDSKATPSNPTPLPYSLDYPPPDFIDPVIEVYKQDIDRASLRENLKLTVEERLHKYQSFLKSRTAWQGAAARTVVPTPGQSTGDET